MQLLETTEQERDLVDRLRDEGRITEGQWFVWVEAHNGYTQTEIAAYSYITQGTVSKWLSFVREQIQAVAEEKAEDAARTEIEIKLTAHDTKDADNTTLRQAIFRIRDRMCREYREKKKKST